MDEEMERGYRVVNGHVQRTRGMTADRPGKPFRPLSDSEIIAKEITRLQSENSELKTALTLETEKYDALLALSANNLAAAYKEQQENLDDERERRRKVVEMTLPFIKNAEPEHPDHNCGTPDAADDLICVDYANWENTLTEVEVQSLELQHWKELKEKNAGSSTT